MYMYIVDVCMHHVIYNTYIYMYIIIYMYIYIMYIYIYIHTGPNLFLDCPVQTGEADSVYKYVNFCHLSFFAQNN